MGANVTVPELAETLLNAAGAARYIVALAGPPAAGKSHIAEKLEQALNASGGAAAILPMDGFHYDNAVLDMRGLLPVKGAPETFDVDGMKHLLQRLARNDEAEVAVPVFDRSIEVSRASARIIPQSVRILIVEGNYLLLDAPPWTDLAQRYDATVLITAPEPILKKRLQDRWKTAQLPEDDIRRKVEENDLPNARLVLSQSRAADFIVQTG